MSDLGNLAVDNIFMAGHASLWAFIQLDNVLCWRKIVKSYTQHNEKAKNCVAHCATRRSGYTVQSRVGQVVKLGHL